MRQYSGVFTIERAHELLSIIESRKLTPYLLYSEYRKYSSKQLDSLFISELIRKASDGCFFVHVDDGTGHQAWALIVASEFDSSVFGFRVGMVIPVVLSQGIGEAAGLLFKSVKSFSTQNGFRYLSLSINTNDLNCQSLINAAMGNGFYYINTLLTFGFVKETFSELNLDYCVSPELVIRKSKLNDFDELYELARQAYVIDRYHLDPHLPRSLCDKLYAESFRNSFNGGYVDIIFVAEYHEKAIGYFSGRLNRIEELSAIKGTGVISSVNDKYRGMGAFQAMNKALIQWMNEVSDFSEWGTYINNQPVHSVYIKSRMRLVRGSVQMACFHS